MKQFHLCLATFAATLFAGTVVADNHSVPGADPSTKAASARVVAAKSTPGKRAVLNSVERHQADLVDLSDRIWAYAETALRETRSAAALADYAEQQGFKVERGVAGMPTAFVATYGSGRPVIGVMGEYDALPGVSQKASPVQEPLRGRCCRSRLRAQPVRRRQPRRGDRDQGADRGRQAEGHGEVLRYAGRGRRRRQGLHGARRVCSTMSTRCSPGTRATRPRPTWCRARRWSAWSSSSRAARRMPRAIPGTGAARSTPPSCSLTAST